MGSVLIYALLCLIWGSTWLVIRIGLADMPPFWSLALRLLVGLVFLAVLCAVRRTDLRIPREKLALVLVVGFFIHPVSYSLVYWGEQYVTSGMAAVLFSWEPLFVAVFSWWLLPGERVTPGAAAGLVLGIAGLVVIYWEQMRIGDLRTVIGMAAISTSGLIAAATTVAIRRWLTRIPALALATTTLAVGAFVVPGLAAATESAAEIRWSGAAVAAVIYLGICGSGISFVLFYRLLARLPALTMSLVAIITPVVALFLASLFDREVHTVRSMAGTAMVLAGVLLTILRLRTAAPGARSR